MGLDINAIRPSLRGAMENAVAEQSGDKAQELKERLAIHDEIRHAVQQKRQLAEAEMYELFPEEVTKARWTGTDGILTNGQEYDIKGRAFVDDRAMLTLSVQGNYLNFTPEQFEPVDGTIPIPFESDEERRLWGDLPRKRVAAASVAEETMPPGEIRLQKDIRVLERAIFDGKATLVMNVTKYEGLTGIKVERSF